MSDYKQAITNEDGELLGYDYHYDDDTDGWTDGYGYGTEDYGPEDYDEPPSALDGFPDLEEESWVDGYGQPTDPPEWIRL